MGFWSFLRTKRDDASTTPESTADQSALAPLSRASAAAPPSTEKDGTSPLEALASVGLPDGPSFEEAEALLARSRRTMDEAEAVEHLVRAAGERPLSETLLGALATALVERGEPTIAARVLERASSLPALVLRADLAEAAGDDALARTLLERVLLRAWDHPGARERHARLLDRAGLTHEPPRIPAGATVVTHAPTTPFELVREVGRGGAGTVYEAVDRALGRRVALKIHHAGHRDRGQLVHEARLAVKFAGAGVVRVYDVDPNDGWIALEWMPFGALRDHLREPNLARLLPIDRWALPLASVLARMHAHGWVHHDVKPANVLLDREGRAVLTDFGTARAVGTPSPPGSDGYVSPERRRGRASDPRDDVYGFGRVLEDVLDAVADASVHARYGSLAAQCTGADDERPSSGEALLARLSLASSTAPTTR